MGDRDAGRAKLLFVLSNDHGELSNAMYLVTGGAFETVLLMPERLFALNTSGLPGRAFRYGSVQDVIGCVDREAPDIVFLFSGYLYGINNLFDVDAVERTVSEIIREARRPTGEGTGMMCDASLVITERAAFWLPLAEDQERAMAVEVARGPVLVRTSGEDLATCVDILLENVFSHTGEGEAFGVRLSRRAGGGAWLVVADDGPGFPGADATERGRSGGGSTGLGLDIARRIAEASGGGLTIGRSTSGGGAVTVGLGPPPRPPDGGRRHRRVRERLQRTGPPDEWAAGETPWSLLGSSRIDLLPHPGRPAARGDRQDRQGAS